jgi:hypothetical protein
MDWTSYHNQIEQLEEVAVQGSRTNFEQFGNVKPVAIVLITRDWRTGAKTSPRVVIVPLDLSSDKAKAAAMDALRRLVTASEAVAIALITEIWHIERAKADLPFLPRPAECADREESVLVHIEMLLGARTLRATIQRHSDGTGVLGPWKELEGYNCGRMTGFIKPLAMGKA